MVSVSVRYLFYQPTDVKIKTWTFRFPAKENPNIIGEGIVGLANRVAVWRQSDVSTNQIALFPFVCCFCFVRALSFQGYTKIVSTNHTRYATDTSKHSYEPTRSRQSLSPRAFDWFWFQFGSVNKVVPSFFFLPTVNQSKKLPEPWVAFLVSLIPYKALILVGAMSLALKEAKRNCA